MRTKKSELLTLRDRLSQLTYVEACKLLGPDGQQLIQQGSTYETEDFVRDIYLGDDLFRFNIRDAGWGDGAQPIVTITLMAEEPQRLRFNCTHCPGVCEHIGAAVSLILEEKSALGLATLPPDQLPMESLSEEQLVAQALAERQERAREETFRVHSRNARQPWTDYLITSATSGKTYRLALRGEERGESYCSCPDFRTNTLGTCKHIMYALDRVRKRFSAAERKRKFRQNEGCVHLLYGEELTLHLRLPDKADEETIKIAGRAAEGPIEDVGDLVRRVRRLQQAGCEVTVYPDAEEFINRRLFQQRIAEQMDEIRKTPAKHPLRTSLLKTPLLPYQLDGIAFAVKAGRAILADDMGLGKTIQGVGVAEMLAREAQIERVPNIAQVAVA